MIIHRGPCPTLSSEAPTYYRLCEPLPIILVGWARHLILWGHQSRIPVRCLYYSRHGKDIIVYLHAKTILISRRYMKWMAKRVIAAYCLLVMSPRMNRLMIGWRINASGSGIAAAGTLTIPTRGFRCILWVLVEAVTLSSSSSSSCNSAWVITHGITIREHHAATVVMSVPSHGDWGVILPIRINMIEEALVMLTMSTWIQCRIRRLCHSVAVVSCQLSSGPFIKYPY